MEKKQKFSKIPVTTTCTICGIVTSAPYTITIVADAKQHPKERTIIRCATCNTRRELYGC